jgi:hypothetical protein
VDGDGVPAGQDWISPLREVLNDLDPGDREAISQLIVLHRELPAWAVWLPCRGRPWIATRAASSRVPGPGLPMMWVQALTAAELANRMRAIEAQLSSPSP